MSILTIPIVALLACSLALSMDAQTTRDACVQLNVETKPDYTTTIRWDAPPSAQPAHVRMRVPGDRDWTDLSIVPSAPWSIELTSSSNTEIEVIQLWSIDTITYVNSGYASINRSRAKPVASRNRVLIITDNESATALTHEIDRLVDDLLREGWIAVTASVSPGATVRDVKAVITATYEDSTNGQLTHVLLLGTIPYAISGGFSVRGAYPNPDYHPEHGGAWGSDAYYADLETSPGIGAEYQWTDSAVSITDHSIAIRPENRNTPGDGKWDNSMIPTDLELCVGRVDMADLPAFGTLELDRTRELALLKNYLDKDHNYRSHRIEPPRRALVDDNFGVFSYIENDLRITEAFGSSGWRSFAPIVGTDSIVEGDWIPDQHTPRPTLDTFGVLLAYGCGGGGYDHCDFVANTPELAQHSNLSVFTLLFGSYFGDVSSTDNVMRAVLAQDGWTLTSGWSGRPHWQLHQLAVGATIGECARASANNAGEYLGATLYDSVTHEFGAYPLGNRGIHVLLLGDPTLRIQGPYLDGTLDVVTSHDGTTTISWPAAATHPAMQLVEVSYVIEASSSLDQPFSILDVVTGTIAVVRLSATDHFVRVRPFFTAAHLAANIFGRGIIAPRPVPITNVPYLPESIVQVAYYDLLGRPFTGPSSQLPHGFWIAVAKNGKGLIHGVWK